MWWCLFICFWFSAAQAQVATGMYPYGTFDSKGFDTINVGNLNVHLSIPILTKPGRGIPFSYRLTFDNSVWQPVTVNSAKYWEPVTGFGWHGATENVTGYMSDTFQSIQSHYYSGKLIITCDTTYMSNWIYHDPFGVQHPFGGQVVHSNCPNGPSINNPPGLATDDSGYSYANYVLTTKSGATIVPGLPPSEAMAAGSVTDSNGNQISHDGNGNFTDTTGTKVLSISGVAPNPQTYTYTDATGNAQTVTVSFKSYTVQTAFSCSSVNEYGPLSSPLVDTISFPDGSAYHFSYEPTPGVSGNVTGRLAAVTLPQGGQINYSYTGGSNGIVCTDGSNSGLTRKLTSDPAGSIFTYSRAPGSGTSQTTVTDGLGNVSVYDFVEASNPFVPAAYYETQRSVSQGSGGTPLLTRQTCYNGVAPNCTTAAFAFPIAQIDTYETVNGAQQMGSTAKYNQHGFQTERDDYDFGGSGSRGILLDKEVWSYPSTGISSLVSSDAVLSGSGTLTSQINYSYDQTAPVATSNVPQHISAGNQRGNLTNLQISNPAGGSFGMTSVYEDTGDVLSSTTPAGTSRYAYDSATHAFMTSSTSPMPSSGVSLSTSANYYGTTGQMQTSTDANAATVTYHNNDPLLRTTEIDYPDGGRETYSYYINQIGHNRTMNGSAETNTQTLYDGYGRVSRVAVGNSQGSNPYYQKDLCYDADGNVRFQSYQYQGNGWGTPQVCSGAGDAYSYDALGRVTAVLHGDGTSVHYQYQGRATLVTDENGVARISQVDGLGRVTAVCEMSSSTNMLGGGSAAPCGLDIGGTGFLTSYAYDLANHKTTITQGAQTRVFQTDWLGRPILTQEPESGTSTYSYTYNSTGLLATRKRPRANQTNASVLTTTTTQYDALGRVVTISYDDGTTPNKVYFYDVACCWSNASSAVNVKGRLVAAGAETSAADHTGDLFSYDSMGRITEMWQCGPSTCPTGSTQLSRPPLTFTYDWVGNLTSEGDGASGVIAYGRSQAGEVTSITNQTYQNTYNPSSLVSNIQNGPNGPLLYSLGNGLTGVRSYDSLGCPNGGWVCKNSSQPECGGGSQLYGWSASWKGTRLLEDCDTVESRCASDSYDEFNRLTASSGGTATYNYSYDRYGNRWQQMAQQGGPSPSLTFNQANNQIISGGFKYDAAGNMIADGIHTYTYDAEGNILNVDNGATAQYVYDAFNHRVRVQTGSSAYEYLYDYAGHRISSWQVSNNFGNEGRIYWGNLQIAYRSVNGTTYFEHKNWLGTERLRTDYTGATAATYQSLSFGDGYTPNILQSAADQDNNHFATLDHDSETATEHAQFRQYASAQGLWMSPDPYPGSYDFNNPKSFNRYSYVLNNPLGAIRIRLGSTAICGPDVAHLAICVEA